jgi:hypothetical protein
VLCAPVRSHMPALLHTCTSCVPPASSSSRQAPHCPWRGQVVRASGRARHQNSACDTPAGVPPLKPGHNPATWMLEVTGGAMAMAHAEVEEDWPDLYASSEQAAAAARHCNALVLQGAKEGAALQVVGKYAQPFKRQVCAGLCSPAAPCCRCPLSGNFSVAGRPSVQLVDGGAAAVYVAELLNQCTDWSEQQCTLTPHIRWRYWRVAPCTPTVLASSIPVCLPGLPTLRC